MSDRRQKVAERRPAGAAPATVAEGTGPGDSRPPAPADPSALALALAVAAGSGKDLGEICARFLETLVRGADLEQAAIWLADESARVGAPGSLGLVGAFPTTRGLPARLAPDSPLIAVEPTGFRRRPDLCLGIVPDDFVPCVRLARIGHAGVLLVRRRTPNADDADLEALRPVLAVLHRGVSAALEEARLRGLLRQLEAEQARRADDATRLSALLDSVHGGVLVEDDLRRIALVNRQFCGMFAVPAPPDSLVGLDARSTLERAQGWFRAPAAFLARVRAPASQRGRVTDEVLALTDGRVVEYDLLPVERHGRVVGNLWLFRDVTARRRAQAAVEVSESRKRAILSTALDAVITTTEAGDIVDFNPAAQAIFGLEARTAVGQPLSLLLAPETPPRPLAERLRALAGQVLEVEARRADGSAFPASVAVSAAQVEDEGRIYTVVARDVTERRRTQEQLRAAMRAAEESALAKQQFLANMSHEIRTPLNAVIGMTHLLAATELDARQERYLHAIGFSADTLLSLISDILDFSKIESGRIEFEAVAFEVRELVQGLADALLGTAEKKGLTLACSVAPGVPRFLRGDPTRLKQILLNLLGNALKFTDRGGVSVSVDARTEGARSEARFRVADTGPGIAPEKRETIFEAFSQASSDVARRYGGTGLGLAIVRQLVERQGGAITLESTPGQGTVFEVRLPFEALPPEAAPGGYDPAAGRAAEPGLAGVRVLVVEDNEVNQMVATELLAQVGVVTAVAQDGIAALERLRRESFDAVLLDIKMPRLDGFETARRIRADLGLNRARLPIIALTASALLEEKQRALDAGMDDFLLKPFRPADLFQRLAALLASRRSLPPSPAAVPAAAGAEAVIDQGLLEDRSVGQDELVVQVIDLFAMQAEVFGAEFTDACAAGDRARVRSLAAGFRSAAELVGALRLAQWLDGIARHPTASRGGAAINGDLAGATLEVVQAATETLGLLRGRYLH